MTSLLAFNEVLQAAQIECDVIDTEIARLQHDDPEARERYFSLVDQRRLIGERILDAIEALGAPPLAPASPKPVARLEKFRKNFSENAGQSPTALS